MKNIEFPTVGEILSEEFMKPNHISAYFLAKSISVPVSRIQDILHNRRAVSLDTSIRLGKFFNVSERYFLNLQLDIDSRKIHKEKVDSLGKIVPFSSLTIRRIKEGEKEDISEMNVFNPHEKW